MLTTALALLCAHLIADYLLQTDWIIARKKQPAGMGAHIGIVFITALLALPGDIVPALAITGIHLLIDLTKTHFAPEKLWTYLADQAAHVGSILLILIAFPQITSLWPDSDMLTTYLATFAGLIITVWAGGPAIGLLMQDFQGSQGDGLPNAGRMIGMLERAVIFLLVLTGQPAAIGFLIAAKSVLRFDTASKDQKASEYVIIGTLASFGWALLFSFGTVKVIAMATLP